MATKSDKPANKGTTFGSFKSAETAQANPFPNAPIETAPTTQLQQEIIAAAAAGVIEHQHVKQAARMGRPKGVDKVKKTFYLTSGIDNLKTARAAIVNKTETFPDESAVADLALAFLAQAVKDPTQLAQVVDVYNQQIKK
jgi:hypothetical protein